MDMSSRKICGHPLKKSEAQKGPWRETCFLVQGANQEAGGGFSKPLSFEGSLRWWKAKLLGTPENWPLETELDSRLNGRLSLSLSPLVLYCISYS